jgi:hypothetical protein
VAVEAELMLNPITTAPAAVPVWMVQVQVDLAGSGTRSPGDGDLEPMVELMYRTEGVRSVAVVPLHAGLAVAVGLDAPEWSGRAGAGARPDRLVRALRRPRRGHGRARQRDRGHRRGDGLSSMRTTCSR